MKNLLPTFRHVALVSFCFLPLRHLPPAAAAEKPNILLIMADDMGYSDLGCYGSDIHTPNLDALAAGGLQFTHFYNTGRCCPSRAALMTGLYPHQAGVGHMSRDRGLPSYRGELGKNTVTIAEVLGAAGYRTMMTGKWHLGWNDYDSPDARGFDRFYGTRGYIDSYFTVVNRTEVYLDDKLLIRPTERPTNHLRPDTVWYTTDVFTDYAIEFIDEAVERDTPFFLYAAYNAPHFPLHAHKADIAKYRGKFTRGWDIARRERFERMRRMGLLDRQWKLSPQDSPPWDSLSAEEKDEMDFRMAVYAAIVDRLDQNVGRLVESLKRSGQFDNTVILFLSDNGGSSEVGIFGLRSDTAKAANYDQWQRAGGWTSSYGQGWANVSNVPFRMYKRYSHEGGISAPLIAHWPDGIESRGTLCHRPAHIIDILATCAELARAEYPQRSGGHTITPTEGISLVPIFLGKEEDVRREALYWEHEGNRAVRQGKWKLVARHKQPWELFDMEADRTETHDLAAEQPDRVAKMASLYKKWADRAGVVPWDELNGPRK